DDVRRRRLDSIVGLIVRKAVVSSVIFFFQAEDGIRYRNVTGVQTCALPIFQKGIMMREKEMKQKLVRAVKAAGGICPKWVSPGRSEERRVGKECRSRGAPAPERKEEEKRRSCTGESRREATRRGRRTR